eukprot:2631391-Prymnesium_polylepis.1
MQSESAAHVPNMCREQNIMQNVRQDSGSKAKGVVGHCLIVELSDCRIVGLSDCRIVGLSGTTALSGTVGLLTDSIDGSMDQGSECVHKHVARCRGDVARCRGGVARVSRGGEGVAPCRERVAPCRGRVAP